MQEIDAELHEKLDESTPPRITSLTGAEIRNKRACKECEPAQSHGRGGHNDLSKSTRALNDPAVIAEFGGVVSQVG